MKEVITVVLVSGRQKFEVDLADYMVRNLFIINVDKKDVSVCFNDAATVLCYYYITYMYRKEAFCQECWLSLKQVDLNCNQIWKI